MFPQLFVRLKKQPFLLIVPFCLLAFFPFSFLGLNIGIKFLLLAVSSGLYWLFRKSPINEFAGSASRTGQFIFIIIALYAGFCIVGQQLFFVEYPVQQVLKKTIFFILFCTWLSFLAFAFLYFTHVCKEWFAAKNNTPASATPRSPLKVYLIFLGILIGCWSVYLIGFFPGNLSPDSLDCWKQALHIKPLNDTHPILYALIIRALTPIWHSPAIIVILQILALAGVCASFFAFIYKAGVPYKWLLPFVILTAIFPTNGIMVIVLWKDILFCTCLVWLTLVIAEIVANKYLVNQQLTLICLAVSLVSVALLRHNGVFAAFFVSLVLTIWAIKNKRTGVVLSISLFLLVFFTYKKVLMPFYFKVPAVPTAFQKAPLAHGIGSVIYHDGELSKETRMEMEKLLPDSMWKSQYNPYSTDEYLFYTTPDFVSKLSDIPTTKILSHYTSTFIRNPFLITKDRLSSSELLWNVFQAEGASNYSYEPFIEPNDLGIEHHENGLHKGLMGLIKFAGGALDPISRRCGIFNILLLLLLLFMFKQRKITLLVFLPLIGANMSLLLSMTYQSYRYVYYIPLLFVMLWLLAVSPIFRAANTQKK